MPKFGICGPLSIASDAQAAGWDYIEGSSQALFQGDTPDDAWTGEALIAACPLPVRVANLLVPADLKIVGPAVDTERLTTYLNRVVARAARCGTKMLVFGSGAARNVPEGFDRGLAQEQIIAFASACGVAGEKVGVELVFEPLNRGECNIINGVTEAMDYVEAVGMANVRCLVDSYHSWVEGESPDDIASAVSQITHVHVADEIGRDAPGSTGSSDYRSFFHVLKQGGYDRRISVESPKMTADRFATGLAFLKTEWAGA